jgi:hypothetical protein
MADVESPEEIPDPEPVITQKLLGELLMMDHVECKERRWQLYGLEEIKEMHLKLYDPDLLILNERYNSPFDENPATKLTNHYTELNYLLSTFPLVVAGGSVFKAVTSHNFNTSDADCFFYGDLKPDEAEDIIKKICMHFLELGPGSPPIQHVPLIARNQNVTTIIHNRIKYQFIHRIYPTKDSIIGGFDLYCCAIFWDGTSFQATRIGAFCVANKMNILNLTKRSPSYEYRLKKYTKIGVSIVVPAIPVHAITAAYGMIFAHTKLVDLTAQGRILFRLNHLNQGVIQIPDDKTQTEDKSDYGDIIRLVESNMQFAIHNKTDCITWRINSVNDFENPKIPTAVTTLRILTPRNDLLIGAPNYLNSIYQISNVFYTDNNRIQFELRKWFGTSADYVYGEFLKVNRQIADLKAQIPNIGHWDAAYHEHPVAVSVHFTIMELYDLLESLSTSQIERNLKIAQENAIAIKWLTTNPGRQWTSSLNLTNTKPRDYYNPKLYTPYYIGVPEPVETLLRLCTKHKIGPFQHLNRDTLNAILKRVVL